MVGCHHHWNGTRPRQCAHRGTVDRACMSRGPTWPPAGPGSEILSPLEGAAWLGTNAFYHLFREACHPPDLCPGNAGATRAMAKRTCLPLSTIYVGKGTELPSRHASSVPVISKDETPKGIWSPCDWLKGRGSIAGGWRRRGQAPPGPRVRYPAYRPVVVALNTQSDLDASLIDLRVASHPVRLLADCETHARLPQPSHNPLSRACLPNY